MNTSDFTVENVRQWLEGSPVEPGPSAADLHGFVIAGHFYCNHCCGRLGGRGILLPRESEPIWKDTFAPPICSACGKKA